MEKAREELKEEWEKRIDQWTEQERRIMARMTVLPEFILEQAPEVTAETDAAAVIAHLAEKEAYLFQLPRLGKRYRLSREPRQILEEALARSGENRVQLLCRCGEWYDRNDQPIEAIRYYGWARQDEMILKILSRRGASEFYDEIPALIEGVFCRCSEALKQRYPMAHLAYLHSASMHDQTGWASSEIAKVKARVEQGEKTSETDRILGEIALMESFFQFNDMTAMMRYHRMAESYFHDGTSWVFSRDMVFTFGAAQILYLYHRTPGELLTTVKTIERDLNCFVHLSGGCGGGGAVEARAEYLFETGEWEKAQHAACQAYYYAGLHNQLSIQLDAKFLLMRCALAQGDWKEYQLQQRELRREKRIWRHPLLSTTATLMEAYLWAVSAEQEGPGNMEQVLNDGEVLVAGKGWREIVCGVVFLRHRNYTRLAALSEAMLEDYGLQKHVFALLYAQLFRAVAMYALGDIDSGKEAIEKALQIGRTDGIYMPFVEMRETLAPLLEMQRAYREFVERIYSFPWRGRCLKEQEVQALTKREQKVLELLADGYKRPEIAQVLHVSENTVRKHLQNSYRKLNASTRAEAILAYRANQRYLTC